MTPSPLKILMLSSDRLAFDEGSAVRKRLISYGALVGELHVIINARRSFRLKPQQVSDRVWLYPTNSLFRWFYGRDALRIGKRFSGITLITAQDPFEIGSVAVKLAKALNSRLELQVHTDFLSPHYFRHSLLNRVRVALAKKNLPKADCVRVVSARIAHSIEKAGIALKGAPFVLPIIIEKSALGDKGFLKSKYSQFHFIVLLSTRIAAEKGVLLALRAFKCVHERYPNVGMVVVGDGPGRASAEALTRAFGIEKNVVFEGWQNNLASYYAGADVLLAPSEYEGYGRMLIEAGLQGLPIVATDVGIIGEVFKDRESALVCPVGDSDCLSRSIISLIEDNNLRTNLGVHARENAEASILSEAEYLGKLKARWESCGATH